MEDYYSRGSVFHHYLYDTIDFMSKYISNKCKREKVMTEITKVEDVCIRAADHVSDLHI